MDAVLVRAYLAALPDVPPDEKTLERVRFCLTSLQGPDVRYLVASVVGPAAARVARAMAAVTTAAGAPTGLLGRSLADTTAGGSAFDDALLGRAGTLAAASGYQLADTRPDLGELSRRDASAILALLAFAEAGQRVAILVDESVCATDPAHAPRPDLVVITGGTIDTVAAALALVPDGCPCVVGEPADTSARDLVEAAARERGMPMLVGGRDHRIEESGGRWTFFVRDDPYVTVDPVAGTPAPDASTALAAALALGMMGIRMREEWIHDGIRALRGEEAVRP